MPDAHTIRTIAVAATADPRTVRRYLRGETVKHTSAARVRAALAELGLADPRDRSAHDDRGIDAA